MEKEEKTNEKIQKSVQGFLKNKNLRPILAEKLTKIIQTNNPRGPSINDITHFLRFLTPPSPLSSISLKRLMKYRHFLADTLSSLSG